MTVLLFSTVMCAINWFEPDGSLHSKGEYVWPQDIVADVVREQVNLGTKFTPEVICVEQ